MELISSCNMYNHLHDNLVSHLTGHSEGTSGQNPGKKQGDIDKKVVLFVYFLICGWVILQQEFTFPMPNPTYGTVCWSFWDSVRIMAAAGQGLVTGQ